MAVEMFHEEDVQIELTENQARQGLELHAMRYVLWISMSIAVVAMVATYLVVI